MNLRTVSLVGSAHFHFANFRCFEWQQSCLGNPFSASMLCLVGGSEVAWPKCSQFRGVRWLHFTVLDLEIQISNYRQSRSSLGFHYRIGLNLQRLNSKDEDTQSHCKNN